MRPVSALLFASTCMLGAACEVSAGTAPKEAVAAQSELAADGPMSFTCPPSEASRDEVIGGLLGNDSAKIVLRKGPDCRSRLLLREGALDSVIDDAFSHRFGVDGAIVAGAPVVCSSNLTTDLAMSTVLAQVFDVRAAQLRCYSRDPATRAWSTTTVGGAPGAQWLVSIEQSGQVRWLRDSKVELSDLGSGGRPATDGVWQATLTPGPRTLALSAVAQSGAMPVDPAAPSANATVTTIASISLGTIPLRGDTSRDVVGPGNNFYRADGFADRSYLVNILGPIKSLTLASTDGRAAWDTIDNAVSTPSYPGRLYTLGTQTFAMRVRDVATDSWMSAPLLGDSHELEIFIADPASLPAPAPSSSPRPSSSPSPSASPSPAPSPSAAPVVPPADPATLPTPTNVFGWGAEFILVVERPDGSTVVAGPVPL